MFSWLNKNKAKAALRRKMRLKRKEEQALNKQRLENNLRVQALANLRSAAQLAIADTLNLVGHYYSNRTDDIRNIHLKMEVIVDLSGNSAFYNLAEHSLLVKHLFWLSTTVPENRNEVVKTAIKAMADYRAAADFKTGGCITM